MSDKLYIDISRGLKNAFEYVIRGGVRFIEEKEIKSLKEELEAEKKIVDYYADNGYSVAVKRVKARIKNTGEN